MHLSAVLSHRLLNLRLLLHFLSCTTKNALAPDFPPKKADHRDHRAAIVPISCPPLPPSLFMPLLFADTTQASSFSSWRDSHDEDDDDDNDDNHHHFHYYSNIGMVAVLPRVRLTPLGSNPCARLIVQFSKMQSNAIQCKYFAING